MASHLYKKSNSLAACAKARGSLILSPFLRLLQVIPNWHISRMMDDTKINANSFRDIVSVKEKQMIKQL